MGQGSDGILADQQGRNRAFSRRSEGRILAISLILAAAPTAMTAFSQWCIEGIGELVEVTAAMMAGPILASVSESLLTDERLELIPDAPLKTERRAI